MGNVTLFLNTIELPLDSFEVMTRNIKKRMVKNICQSMITFDKEGMPVIHFP